MIIGERTTDTPSSIAFHLGLREIRKVPLYLPSYLYYVPSVGKELHCTFRSFTSQDHAVSQRCFQLYAHFSLCIPHTLLTRCRVIGTLSIPLPYCINAAFLFQSLHFTKPVITRDLLVRSQQTSYPLSHLANQTSLPVNPDIEDLPLGCDDT